MLRGMNLLQTDLSQMSASQKRNSPMKHLNRLVASVAILLSFFSSNAQDTGQKIRVSQGRTVLGTYGATGAATDSESPATVPINSLAGITFEALDATPNTVGNKLCVGVNDGNCGWYKGFWIFGDGNYQSFSDNLTQLDTPSRTIINYRYAVPGTYNPVVYLTEKYHNTKPPEEARAFLNVSSTGASGSYVETTQRLANITGRNLDVDFNHQPRVDYPMNFVLSYRKSEPASLVLFYYNSLISNNYSTWTPTGLFSFKSNEATDYQGAGFTPVVENDIAPTAVSPGGLKSGGRSGSILDALNSKFKSRLVYDVSDFPGALPDNMTELRVFPVIQTVSLDSLPENLLSELPTTRFPTFATILVGTDSVGPNDPAYGLLLKNALTLFGNLSSLRLSPNSQLYIRGIELTNMKLETSHDPNSLVVTDIVAAGGGKYKVTFRMIICNKGQGTESRPSLVFNDLTGGKYNTKPVLGDVNGATVTWSGGDAGSAWVAELNGFTITGVPENYAPSCRELFFTIETDANGVNRLYQSSPRALEVCVNFSTGSGECSKNEPLLKDAFQLDSNRDANAGIRCDGILRYLLLLILGLIVLWYLLIGRSSN